MSLLDEALSRIALLERKLERLMLLQRMSVGFGRITAPAIDDGPVQQLQVRLSAHEVRDNTPNLMSYGFTSHPPVDSDVLAVFMGGDRSNGLVVAVGHQSARKRGLAPGDSGLYDNRGHSLLLNADGIAITGNLRVSGSVIAGAGTANQINLQTHRHGTGIPAAGTVPPNAGT